MPLCRECINSLLIIQAITEDKLSCSMIFAGWRMHSAVITAVSLAGDAQTVVQKVSNNNMRRRRPGRRHFLLATSCMSHGSSKFPVQHGNRGRAHAFLVPSLSDGTQNWKDNSSSMTCVYRCRSQRQHHRISDELAGGYLTSGSAA